MAGCGKDSSNPIKNYSNLKARELANPNRKLTDDEVWDRVFSIHSKGDSDRNFIEFTEGQQASFDFEVTPLDGHITDYTVDFKGRPSGASFSRSTVNPNVWTLTWTPPLGTVPGQQFYERRSFSLIAHVTQAFERTQFLGKTSSTPDMILD